MLPVEKVRHTPRREWHILVAQCGRIRNLQILPKAYRPRISTPPGVDGAARIRLRQQDAVVAAHRRERAHAAAKAARENGDLADLTLRVIDGRLRGVEDARRFALVNVAALTEYVQHLIRSRLARQPRIDARLDSGPVGYDKYVSAASDECRSQHTFKNVRNALAEGRCDTVTSDHRISNPIGVFSTTTRKVVDLYAVGTGPSCGTSTSKYKGSSNTTVSRIR